MNLKKSITIEPIKCIENIVSFLKGTVINNFISEHFMLLIFKDEIIAILVYKMFQNTGHLQIFLYKLKLVYYYIKVSTNTKKTTFSNYP